MYVSQGLPHQKLRRALHTITTKSSKLPLWICFQDYVALLLAKNAQRIRESPAYLYLNSRTLRYIFTICARLRVPHPVRFMAALLFDKSVLSPFH